MGPDAHPLKQYLSIQRISQAEFARRSGVAASKICDVFKGRRRRFSPEDARRIRLATNGVVDLDDSLFWRPPQPLPSGVGVQRVQARQVRR